MMVLPDVNILVAAHRADSIEHERCRTWLISVAKGDSMFAMSELVLSGFVRIVTNPRAFKTPSTHQQALQFANMVRNLPHCVKLRPGIRHWQIFTKLCRVVEARGNLVPDAYHAALAIEAGAQWITLDSDFAKFPGLNWGRPPILNEVVHQADRLA